MSHPYLTFLSISLLLLACVFSSGCQFAYELAQGAENDACMKRSNDENKLDCRADDVDYEKYKKQRDALLSSEE